jgi:hypothetical protein
MISLAIGLTCLVAIGCGDGGSLRPSGSVATESPKSDEGELSVEEALRTGLIGIDPPRTPQTVLSGQGVIVKWPGRGDHVAAFQIYRREPADSTWDLLGQLEVNDLSRGEFSFTDETPQAGKTYIYGLTARNEYAQQSKIVESPPITIP